MRWLHALLPPAADAIEEEVIALGGDSRLPQEDAVLKLAKVSFWSPGEAWAGTRPVALPAAGQVIMMLF